MFTGMLFLSHPHSQPSARKAWKRRHGVGKKRSASIGTAQAAKEMFEDVLTRIPDSATAANGEMMGGMGVVGLLLSHLVTSLTHLLLSALAGALSASTGAWINSDPTTALVLESGLLAGFLYALLPETLSFIQRYLSGTSPSSSSSTHRRNHADTPIFSTLRSHPLHQSPSKSTIAKLVAALTTSILTSLFTLRFSEEAWTHSFAIIFSAVLGRLCIEIELNPLGLSVEDLEVKPGASGKGMALLHRAQGILWHGLAGIVVVRGARFSGFYMCRTKAGLFAGLTYGAVMWCRHLPMYVLGRVQRWRWEGMDRRGVLGGGSFDEGAFGGRIGRGEEVGRKDA